MGYKQYESAAEDWKRAFTLLYDFFLLKDAPNRFRRHGALREPILRSLCVDFHLNGISNRVVLSDHLQKPAVARSAFIDYYNPVIGPLCRPDPGKTHRYQLSLLLY